MRSNTTISSQNQREKPQETSIKMCPCFPFSDVEFEEEPRQKKGNVYQYVWNGQNWELHPYSRRHRNVSIFNLTLVSLCPFHLAPLANLSPCCRLLSPPGKSEPGV
jgi:hypothetical protein